MTTLFISDLHLDDSRPDSTAQFEQFVRDEALHCEALYILGDLFEFWMGDDVSTSTSERVEIALSGIHAVGIPCYFLHGNRDFVLGDHYASSCGMQLLPEEIVVDLYGTATLLMHGDTLCTDDIAYQQFRRMARSEEWQQQMLALSIHERKTLVEQGRQQSLDHQLSVSMDIMDVNLNAVEDAFQRHGVTELIHGHTHRPDIHELQINQLSARRIVLGDWYEQGSVLRVSPKGSELIALN